MFCHALEIFKWVQKKFKNRKNQENQSSKRTCKNEKSLILEKMEKPKVQRNKQIARIFEKNQSFLILLSKELLFSLNNYVWDEKWSFFSILSLIENYPIAIPFELDDFPSNPWPRITLYTRGKILRRITSKIMIDQVPFQ